MTRARDLANLIGSGNYTSTTFTATAGQTVFTIAHTPNFIQVFMNGLLLDETTDYTSNGIAVTLTSAATAGDELEVVKYNTFSVGDAITQTAADSRYVNTTGDTMTGGFNVLANVGIGTSSPENFAGFTTQTINGSTGSVLAMQAGGFGNTARFVKTSSQFSMETVDATPLLFIANNAERMRIDSAGRVTMPYQPAFRAYRNTDPGTTTSFTDMTWTSTEFNVGNHFANNKFTAPVAGTYLFGVNNNMGSGYSVGGWRLYINGSARHVFSYNDFTASWKNASGTTLIQLQANDYAQAYFFGDADWDINWCGFYGYLIG